MDNLWIIYGSGWWLRHAQPLWKILEFVNDDGIPNILIFWKIKIMFQTTNQEWNDNRILTKDSMMNHGTLILLTHLNVQKMFPNWPRHICPGLNQPLTAPRRKKALEACRGQRRCHPTPRMSEPYIGAGAYHDWIKSIYERNSKWNQNAIRDCHPA